MLYSLVHPFKLIKVELLVTDQVNAGPASLLIILQLLLIWG